MADVPVRPSLLAVLGRIFWMMYGPISLLVFALFIAERADGWLAATDLIYLLILVGMLLGRWVEFRSGDPLTAMGEPATPDDLRRYCTSASLLGMGLWVAANLIGNHAWLAMP
jgi:hypothetical protein